MFLRKFIILNKKSDQNAKGHAKLEVRSGKGKVSLNLEGLDTQLDEDDIYKGYLVSNEKNNFKSVDIGIVDLTKDGRGTLDWEFNSSSVGGTGIDIANFNIVLIKLETNHSSKLEIPLGGYIHTDDRTIQIVMNKLEKEVKKVRLKETKIKETEILDTEKIEETQEAEEENIEEKDIELEESLEQDPEEIENLEEIEETDGIEDIGEVEEDIEYTEDPKEIDEVEEDEVEEIERIIQDNLEDTIIQEEIEEISADTDEYIEDEEEYKSVRPMFKKGEHGFIQDLQEYLIDKEIINAEDLEDDSEDTHVEEDIEDNSEYYTEDDYLEDDYIKGEEDLLYDVRNAQGASAFMNDQNYLYNESYANNKYTNDSFANYSQQIANYTLNILKFFKKVSPFKQEFEGYTWWEIEYDKRNINRGFLPYYNYLVNMYYPYNCITKYATSQSQIKKHEHYIFGVVQENQKIRHYVYGIPGKFTEEDQPYGGKTGFVTWFEKEEDDDNLGYWIIYIDALTGNIVRPL
ncbi:hypothetical protein [Gottschalkia acidurici]|uniref:hypothetical protein n=1 Tax=Clostridium acidurici TaxID=1556 RepID=UPI0002E727C6|nr:hypothetical protein [Gottschalkia acidurici]